MYIYILNFILGVLTTSIGLKSESAKSYWHGFILAMIICIINLLLLFVII